MSLIYNDKILITYLEVLSTNVFMNMYFAIAQNGIIIVHIVNKIQYHVGICNLILNINTNNHILFFSFHIYNIASTPMKSIIYRW